MNEQSKGEDIKDPRPKVVIFGAGITGLTVAHELIERGWDVTVFEPEINPLNVDECAIGGLAKTQWSVYHPKDYTEGAPAELRPMVPTVRLRAKGAWGPADAIAAAVEEAVIEVYKDKPDELRRLLGAALDDGSQIYLKRVEDRLAAIRPFAPRMIVRYADSDDPKLHDPSFYAARLLLTYLKVRWGVDISSKDDPQLIRGVLQVETDLTDDDYANEPVEYAGIVPGEHGFRFFPALYRNLFDTLKRIPVLGEDQNSGEAYRTVYDNLVPTEANWMALDDVKLRLGSETAKEHGVVRFPRRLRKSLRESFDALNDMYTELGYTIRDMELLKLRLFKYMTSCRRRRNEQYEGMSWSEFAGLADLSEIAKRDMERAPQLLAAMTAEESDARTQGNLATQLLLDPINADERVDSTLNAPTTVAWLNPWKAYLMSQGVRFVPGRIKGFRKGREGVYPEVECDGHTPAIVEEAGYYVLAIPIQAWTKRADEDKGEVSLLESWRAACAGPDTLGDDHIDYLKNWIGRYVRPEQTSKTLYKWLTGIQYYLDSDDLARSGHTLYMDSPWRLSAISQASFWNRRREPFDGYRGIVSVDIGSTEHGSDAGDTMIYSFSNTPRERVHTVVWQQIERHSDDEQQSGGRCAPGDEWQPDYGCPYRMYRLDEYIKYDSREGKPLRNDAPFLINGVGEWDHRPGWYDPKRDDDRRWEPVFEVAEEDSNARYQLMPRYREKSELTKNAKRWVLAGTFMQTWTRATTMESANESGKHAANTLLSDVKGRRWQPCRIWNPEQYEHSDLRIWQELDEKLYNWDKDEPLPHMVDILELDSLTDALLDGEISYIHGKFAGRGTGREGGR